MAPLSTAAHASPAVLVVGSLYLDTTLSVPNEPLSGETVISTSIFRGAGGKGGNQAVAAAAAGAHVRMIGAVGTDVDGAAIVADLQPPVSTTPRSSAFLAPPVRRRSSCRKTARPSLSSPPGRTALSSRPRSHPLCARRVRAISSSSRT